MDQPKTPLDAFPYVRDPRSRAIAPDIDDGIYIYVRGVDGVIYVLPDGGHLHLKFLATLLPRFTPATCESEREGLPT